ncbi:DUF397 domain-containing protein [Streptomyces jietaisiensis]
MSDELAWFKSSSSDSEGSACLEVVHTRARRTTPTPK